MPRTTHVRLQSGADPGVITRAKRRIFDETFISRSYEICTEKVSFFEFKASFGTHLVKFLETLLNLFDLTALAAITT